MLAFVLVGASHLPPAHTGRASLQPRSVHRLRGGLRTDSTEAADVHLGLRNQGNTCYMNSLLQVLYHVPDFRRAIYSLPTSTAAVRTATARAPGCPSTALTLSLACTRLPASPVGRAWTLCPAQQCRSACTRQSPLWQELGTSSRVVLELQRLFYRLQYAAARGACDVGTEGLTRSFGWGAREVCEQQDVQEFARMLCETLQEHMRASGRPDDVARLFEGTTLNSIRCTRVDFRSEREERWYDLQMPVKGCGGLRASLCSFVKEERLSGDNRYNTRRPELGRQEARRGARLKSVPPVLQLHLKRFEYDARSGGMLKLQQCFRFPTSLQLQRFMASGHAQAPPPQYKLLAVLSHVGHFGSGHYVSYVRPIGRSQWLEFDDTRVSAVAERVAVRGQFGGRHSPSHDARFGAAPNAYMLVYVSEDAREDEPDASLLPSEVRAAFEAELAGRI